MGQLINQFIVYTVGGFQRTQGYYCLQSIPVSPNVVCSFVRSFVNGHVEITE